MNPENDSNLVLTVPEMAQALKISRTTAYQLMRREDFPAARIGARVVVPVDALKRWIEAGGTINHEKRA